MKQFLKDNIALVAAIVLPALLALLFAFSTMFARVTVAAPQNDFLITTDDYQQGYGFNFGTHNDRLEVSWMPAPKDAQGQPISSYGEQPHLWRVHVPDMSVEEISLQRPINTNAAATIAVPPLSDLKVTNISPGPDGYEFVNSYSSSGNLMTEIFSDGQRENMVGIVKNGRLIKIRIPSSNNYYAYNTRFIGWIIK